jgi:putative membrane protein
MADDPPEEGPRRPFVPPPVLASGADSGAASVELSARRTDMSFQRTRMSADRTLMSVMRTSLSLISFGFTIFQFFQHLQDAKILSGTRAARNFGVALVWLGLAMMAVGILFHIRFMVEVRRTRRDMTEAGLIHGETRFPPSYTLATAFLLFLLGLAAIASVAFNTGPLH